MKKIEKLKKVFLHNKLKMGCRASKIQDVKRDTHDLNVQLSRDEIEAIKEHIQVYNNHMKRRSLEITAYRKSLEGKEENFEKKIDSQIVHDMPNELNNLHFGITKYIIKRT